MRAVLLAIFAALSGCALSHVAGAVDAATVDAGPAVLDAGTTDAGGLGPCADDVTCPPHEWCFFPTGDPCGRAGLPGVCQPSPFSCPALPPEAVCGCDGTTYADFCRAISGGVSIASAGACP